METGEKRSPVKGEIYFSEFLQIVREAEWDYATEQLVLRDVTCPSCEGPECVVCAQCATWAKQHEKCCDTSPAKPNDCTRHTDETCSLNCAGRSQPDPRSHCSWSFIKAAPPTASPTTIYVVVVRGFGDDDVAVTSSVRDEAIACGKAMLLKNLAGRKHPNAKLLIGTVTSKVQLVEPISPGWEEVPLG